MNEPDNFALVPRPSGALEKPAPGAKRILTGMIADTLALVKQAAPPKRGVHVLMAGSPEFNEFFPDLFVLAHDLFKADFDFRFHSCQRMEELAGALKQRKFDLALVQLHSSPPAEHKFTEKHEIMLRAETLLAKNQYIVWAGLEVAFLLHAVHGIPVVIVSDTGQEQVEKLMAEQVGARGLFSWLGMDVQAFRKFLRGILLQIPSTPRNSCSLINALARADLDALVLEGKRIRRREGMTAEDIRAFSLFHRAAAAGHSEAQLLVYECYLDGHGVGADVEKALEWFHKSAESGFANAQCRLGDFYQGTQDYNAAVKWYRKAAEQGDAAAQCSLGICYGDGEGVRQDYAEAVKWVRKAAEQGDAIAQKNLGVFYDNGQGVPQDYVEAARWYQKAAEQSLAGAQIDLGVCYEMGQGVPQDHKEAIKWFQKAAAQGNVQAQSNLRRCNHGLS